MVSLRKFLQGIGLIPVSSTAIDTQGEMEVLSASGKLNYHNGTTASPLVTEAHSATLTNKTIDGGSNTLTNLPATSLTGITPVANGGTGLATLTAHALYAGNGTSAPTALAVGATNTVLHGNTGADPSYSAIVNADIDAAAAISFSKLASLTSANILVGSSGNVATSTAVTGDVTITNAGVTAIGSNKVSNSMLAQMAANTIKGNNTGSTANALDLTVAQLLTMLGIRAGSVSLGSGVSTGSATFGTAYSGTGYAIFAGLINTSDASPQFQPVTITTQSTTGFTATLNAPTDSANYSLMYITVLNN